jgi:hypothetical protein
MDIISRLAEEKIKEAIKNGELDNLPGSGKPLHLEDLAGVPPECRAAYKIMKNAGVLPEELEIKKEIVTLQSLIDCCNDDKEKALLKKNLNEKTLRFNILMERRNLNKKTLSRYRNKINTKLGI